MERLVVLLEFDRATFLIRDEKDGRLRTYASWARSGVVEPFAAESFAESFPWTAARLRSGELLSFPRLPDDLPPEAVAERDYCRRIGFKSILTIPITVSGALLGAVSFGAFRAHRPLSDELLYRIRLVGEVFANALARARSEEKLRHALVEIQELKDRLEAENTFLRQDAKLSAEFEEIVGESVALRLVLTQADQVAPTDSTVLITGETGTGKELVARAIHDRSERRTKPFVVVNCSALPAALIESELFGHEKGAFTGAISRKIGRFEVADGGTLLLDEVGELDSNLQPKLLRVLQRGEFERVGSNRTIKVDVRIVAATNRDLTAAVEQERFRADLYYRLSVFPIHVPPLRERREDIPLLAWYFITLKQKKLGKKIASIPDTLMDTLVAYDWPGNVRELENVIERALILSPGPALEVTGLFGAAPAETGASRKIEAIERAHIVAVLRECRWKINGGGNAADRLGLNPSTLRFRMKKLGIERP